MRVWLPVSVSVLTLTAASARATDGAADVRFNRDIRPILAENCFACHGPDAGARKAKLRLDRSEDATVAHHDGTPIVRGHPEQSEILARIASADPDQVMPPPKTGKKVTAAQLQTLTSWIARGAAWEKHWSFIPPAHPATPAVRDVAWCRNEIDRFVLATLESRGMRPSIGADRNTLIRRLSLDLTGTPPSPEEVDDFVNDSSSAAVEKVVDRLLANPHFGERMALQWLDAARYADTNGYNNDADRSMWRWRDWVISAFNSNLPYDQFLTDQVAGDLLPNPTLEQKIATGFNRNHHITTEGGAFEEEYRVEYVNDRVQTTSATFLGLTMRCARCHDHKFDPISQRDYYRFFSYFNNVPEQGVPAYGVNVLAFRPAIAAPTSAQQAELDRLAAREADLDQRIQQRAALADAALPEWERTRTPTSAPIPSGELVMHLKLDETEGALVHDSVAADRIGHVKGSVNWAAGRFGNAFTFDGQSFIELDSGVSFERTDAFTVSAWIKPQLGQPMAIVAKMDDADGDRGFDLVLQGDGRIESHLIHHYPDDAMKVATRAPLTSGAWHAVVVTHDTSGKAAGAHIYVDGVAQDLNVEQDSLHSTIHTATPLHIGRRSNSIGFRGLIDDVRIYNSELDPTRVKQLAEGGEALDASAALLIPVAQRTAAQRDAVRQLYLTTIDPDYRALKTERASVAMQVQQTKEKFPQTMIMQELPTPRETHILQRGEYDKPGEIVSAGVPEWLAPLPGGAPANRLGLARWMTAPANPLVARVAVNRLWQVVFGAGLVETAEDFGTQGEPPEQPELLDWLATQYISSGWNTKAMLRLMVLSNTYQQTSDVSSELLARDPRNRLLGRASRFRLPAELIRDDALAISGLLQNAIGGPSVFPYQPAGLWEEVSVEHKAHYVQGHGEDLYRRSLYSFWKRTSPPPALITVDAADRETCVVRRARTDTPLQALILMNDPTYVEASRKLAERMLASGGAMPEAHLDLGYKLALARLPHDEERGVLLNLFEKSHRRFAENPQEARKLLAVGDSPHRQDLNESELAAWTTVASAILSLDETISRE